MTSLNRLLDYQADQLSFIARQTPGCVNNIKLHNMPKGICIAFLKDYEEAYAKAEEAMRQIREGIDGIKAFVETMPEQPTNQKPDLPS